MHQSIPTVPPPPPAPSPIQADHQELELFENKLANALRPGQMTVPPGSIDTFSVSLPHDLLATFPWYSCSRPLFCLGKFAVSQLVLIVLSCSMPRLFTCSKFYAANCTLSFPRDSCFLTLVDAWPQSTAKTKYGLVLMAMMGQYFQVVL